MRFSAASLVWHALRKHEAWPAHWRDPEPKPAYDVIIVGAGGIADIAGLAPGRQSRAGLRAGILY
jgi:hypothetical protein